RPENLNLFSNLGFMLLLSLYPIGNGVGWVFISFQTEVDESHFVRNHYFAHFNQTINGWRVLHHWRDNHLNVHDFLIILIAAIIMSINFCISIFLASQTIAQIRKAKTFSSNYRLLQIKILRALFAQAWDAIVVILLIKDYR
ncbi:hypothetical protein PENTCL1PPCAC_14517, partial [Pristionchus entomophagus]